MWPAIAAAAIPAIASAIGGERANRQNVQLAREQMAFQERMSSTAYQRGMADMRQAGLNPMLAFQQGGASSPTGALGRVEDVVSPAVSSAMQSVQLRKQLQLVDQEIQKARADAKTARANAQVALSNADRDMAQYRFYFKSDGTMKPAMAELLRSQHNQLLASSARQMWDADLARLSIPEREALAKMWDRVGAAGKGVQTWLPLLLQLLRNR